MDTLNKNIAKKSTAPVKIMQFGEGNFLRAFVDWIIKKMNDSGKYNGHVVVVQPLEFGRVENLKEQDYLYNVYLLKYYVDLNLHGLYCYHSLI